MTRGRRITELEQRITELKEAVRNRDEETVQKGCGLLNRKMEEHYGEEI